MRWRLVVLFFSFLSFVVKGATVGAVTFNTFLLGDVNIGNIKPDVGPRAKVIVDRLSQLNGVDYVGLQEVWPHELRQSMAEDLKAKFPYAVALSPVSPVSTVLTYSCGVLITQEASYEGRDMFRALGRRAFLKGLGWAGGTAVTGLIGYASLNLDYRWREIGMGNGLLLLSADRILQSDAMNYGWAIAELDEAFVNKGIIFARTQRPDGTIIDVYNTHLPSVNDKNSQRQLNMRFKAARYALQFINAHSWPDSNIIVLGDFNVDPYYQVGDSGRFLNRWSREYALFRNAGFIDGYHQAHGYGRNAFTVTSNNPYIDPNEAPTFIDYAWFRGPAFNTTPKNAEFVLSGPATDDEMARLNLATRPEESSDHKGVRVDLELKP